MTKILAATDLSPQARLAENRAKLYAALLGGTLQIVHVIEKKGGATLEAAGRSRPKAAEGRDDLRILSGDPRDVICGLSQNADLLVLGEPRRRTAAGLFTGTTGEQIIRRSAAPVLVVRNNAKGHYCQALLAVDLSAQSVEIMRTSKALGLDSAGSRALYIHETPQVDLMVRTSAYSFGDIQKHMADERQKFLKKLTEQMKQAGLSGSAEALPIKTSAAAEILGFAERTGADLVVIGSRRRSNLAKLVLGSVAAQVLSHSKTDVLIVPPTAAAGAL